MSRHFYTFERLDRRRSLEVRAVQRIPSAHDVRAVRDPCDRFRSAVAGLLSRLYFSPDSPAPRSVVFAAVEEESEGCPICAAAAALLASSVTNSVCLAEANPRSTSLVGWPTAFKCGSGGSGTEDSQRGYDAASFAIQMPSSPLWVLPYGVCGADVDGRSMAQRMHALIASLRSRFEYTLIDAPPLGVCPESFAMGRSADGIVLVLRANSTCRESARRIKHSLEAAGIGIFGAVLYDSPFSQTVGVGGRCFASFALC